MVAGEGKKKESWTQEVCNSRHRPKLFIPVHVPSIRKIFFFRKRGTMKGEKVSQKRGRKKLAAQNINSNVVPMSLLLSSTFFAGSFRVSLCIVFDLLSENFLVSNSCKFYELPFGCMFCVGRGVGKLKGA